MKNRIFLTILATSLLIITNSSDASFPPDHIGPIKIPDPFKPGPVPIPVPIPVPPLPIPTPKIPSLPIPVPVPVPTPKLVPVDPLGEMISGNKTLINIGSFGLIKKEDLQKGVDHVDNTFNRTMSDLGDVGEALFNHPEDTLKSPSRFIKPAYRIEARFDTLGASDIYVAQETKRAAERAEDQQRQALNSTKEQVEKSKNKLEIQTSLNNELNHKSLLVVDIDSLNDTIEVNGLQLKSSKERVGAKKTLAEHIQSLQKVDENIKYLIEDMKRALAPNNEAELSAEEIYLGMAATACYNRPPDNCQPLIGPLEGLIVNDDRNQKITTWFKKAMLATNGDQNLSSAILASIEEERLFSNELAENIKNDQKRLKTLKSDLLTSEQIIKDLQDKLNTLT